MVEKTDDTVKETDDAVEETDDTGWPLRSDEMYTFLKLDEQSDVYLCQHGFVMSLSLLSFRPLSRIKDQVGIK